MFKLNAKYVIKYLLFLVAMIATALLSVSHNLNREEVIKNVFVTAFTSAVLFKFHRAFEGHAPHEKMLCMPYYLLGGYIGSLILILIMGVAHTGFFRYSFPIAWIAGVLDWYLSSYRLTYYMDEAKQRKRYKRMAVSQEEIDVWIEADRADGRLPPKK